MAVYVALVAPLISENPVELEVVDDCHWMVPEYPLKVNVVLLLPLTTDTPPAPEMLPATEVAFTTTAPDTALVAVQDPMVTTQ